MKKTSVETAMKMRKMVRLSTYQGRVTYLALSFLSQTGATFGEVARLTIGDVYANGRVRKWLRFGTKMPRTFLLMSPAADKTVRLALEVRAQHGLPLTPSAPLFCTHSGKAFTAEQLASLFWMYQQAAEL